jgi:hypothetical protein
MTTRKGKLAATFWDREFYCSVQFCERGICKKNVGCGVREWVFHTWEAMELLAGMHITRQSDDADVAYGNFR